MKNPALMAIAGGGGLLNATLALLYLTPFPGLIILSYLAPLPLFLIGLGVGLSPLYGAGLLATGLVFFFEGPLLAAEYFVFSFLGPTFLMYRALLYRKKSSAEIVWYPSSLLLRDVTFPSGIVMIFALGGYLYLTQGGETHVIVKEFLATFDPQGHIREAESLLIKIFPFLPGFFAFSWAMMMFINAVLAQGLLVRFKYNLRPSPSFEGMETPKSFLMALGLSLILSQIGVGHVELLGKNAALVLAFPFFLVGLGLVHKWLHKTSHPTLGLTLFYVLLFIFLWAGFFVILLGILKPWIEKFMTSNE